MLCYSQTIRFPILDSPKIVAPSGIQWDLLNKNGIQLFINGETIYNWEHINGYLEYVSRNSHL